MTIDQNSAGISAGSGELVLTRNGNRLTVTGDIATAAEREQLRLQVELMLSNVVGDDDVDELVLDVAQSPRWDIATLTVLISLARRCIDRGLHLALEGAHDELWELLRVTKIDQVLQRHGTEIRARPAA